MVYLHKKIWSGVSPISFAGLIFVFILSGQAFSAENWASKLGLDWQKKGKAVIRVYQDTVEDNQYEDKEAVDARFRWENRIEIKDWDTFLEINPELRYDLIVRDDTDNDVDLFLKEAYAQVRKKNYSFSVGRQTVTWGKLDDIIILDTLTPQDYSKFILFDKQTRKLPTFMFKYDYSADNYRIEGVYLPIFKPSLVKFFGSDWAVFDHLKRAVAEGGEYNQVTKNTVASINIEENESLNDKTFENGQFGMRLRSKLKDIDYGLYYMYIYQRLPVLKEKTAGGNVVKKFLYEPTATHLAELVGAGLSGDDFLLIEEHPRNHVIGLDYETVVGDYGVRGEVGMFFNQGYLKRDFTYVEKNTLSLGYGLDHTTANNFYYNIQLIQNIIFDYEDLFAQEEVDHRINTTLSRGFLRGKLPIALDSSFSFSYHDWMLNPQVTYKFNNGLDVSLGGFIFEGNPTFVFGRYSTKDLIYVDLTYQF